MECNHTAVNLRHIKGIIWYQDNIQINETSFASISFDNDSRVLIIGKANKVHNGQYSFEIKFKNGQILRSEPISIEIPVIPGWNGSYKLSSHKVIFRV